MKNKFFLSIVIVGFIFFINSVFAQPINQERLGNLTIYSEENITLIKLITPNNTIVNFPQFVILSNNNSLLIYNFTLRNIGLHKLTYNENGRAVTKNFFVTWNKNPLSLPIAWYYLIAINLFIAFILIAFNFWKYAKYTLIIFGFIGLLSDLSLLSVSSNLILICIGWLVK